MNSNGGCGHDRGEWWKQCWGQGLGVSATAQGRLRALEGLCVDRGEDRTLVSIFFCIINIQLVTMNIQPSRDFQIGPCGSQN